MECEKKKNNSKVQQNLSKYKQGRIHGKTVANGWAGAVMQKPLAIQDCDRPNYPPTRLVVQSRVHD